MSAGVWWFADECVCDLKQGLWVWCVWLGCGIWLASWQVLVRLKDKVDARAGWPAAAQAALRDCIMSDTALH